VNLRGRTGDLNPTAFNGDVDELRKDDGFFFRQLE
jgi:hypothetical protein